ncbi:cilia- and flagella-associated protein 300-like [Pollicipes pollicipes]|uniref:cilia- and flagella-associated protein 300-like n=1 Tax=Pollicipes pollicipes TaxID=41117 RepID=UPI001884AC30|nr:cilia- and flagella-associated protein 300-like [Pollicipes pollicipes]
MEAFRFKHINNKEWNFLKNKNITEGLMKWSMLGRISVQAYCYDKHLGVHEAKDWVKEFLADTEVLSTLKVLSSSGSWCVLGAPAEAVSVEEVPCTETSLAMFDKLIDSGVVREDGTIRKCMEVWVGDVVLADELRKVRIS